MDIKAGDLIKLDDDMEDYIVACINEFYIDIYDKNGKEHVIGIEDMKDVEILEVKRPCQYKTIYKRKEILTEEEKDYLRAVIKPFREKINSIAKCGYGSFNEYYILIEYDERKSVIRLPDFEKNTMYKGMELDKEYSLEELGL